VGDDNGKLGRRGGSRMHAPKAFERSLRKYVDPFRLRFSHYMMRGENKKLLKAMNILNPINHYMKFSCIYCGQRMECILRLAGRQFLCPSCQHRIVIPTLRGSNPEIKTLLAAHTWDEFVPLPQIEVPTRHQSPVPANGILAGVT
jgi:DNA-directed RNA polymerase subunit RPC12/RpoP